MATRYKPHPGCPATKFHRYQASKHPVSLVFHNKHQGTDPRVSSSTTPGQPRTTYYAPRTMHHAPRTTNHIPRTTHHESYTTHHESCTTHHAPRIMHHTPRIMHHAERIHFVNFYQQ
ncbi:hypothetical protein E2C01_095579 [Portunus trituberculatus]|uniref:Uncharacterized protein n=1 Tax=Portunus trituberculatus TaxID=210409 RepID=A0A5B7K0P7_PORTR|nr:hypothetical protein [Portunus trituberculatus]